MPDLTNERAKLSGEMDTRMDSEFFVDLSDAELAGFLNGLDDDEADMSGFADAVKVLDMAEVDGCVQQVVDYSVAQGRFHKHGSPCGWASTAHLLEEDEECGSEPWTCSSDDESEADGFLEDGFLEDGQVLLSFIPPEPVGPPPAYDPPSDLVLPVAETPFRACFLDSSDNFENSSDRLSDLALSSDVHRLPARKLERIHSSGHSTMQKRYSQDTQKEQPKLAKKCILAHASLKRKRQPNKKARPDLYGIEFTRLSGTFHLPREEAAAELKIGCTFLKKVCRKLGIKRWPSRKIASIGNHMEELAKIRSDLTKRSFVPGMIDGNGDDMAVLAEKFLASLRDSAERAATLRAMICTVDADTKIPDLYREQYSFRRQMQRVFMVPSEGCTVI